MPKNSLQEELASITEGFAAIERWRKVFGFARLYHCVNGWYISNKTDEGIGGCGPGIEVYGKTPKEVLLMAAKFLKDPKFPKPVMCRKCKNPIHADHYTVNSPNGLSLHFHCWSSGCWESYMADDFCPNCFGELDVVDDGIDRAKRENWCKPWTVKCNECGSEYPRGDGIKIQYANFEFEPIDLDNWLRDEDDE